MNAAEMIDRCFRFQNPEAYGREPIDDPPIPPTLRYGPPDADYVAAAPMIAEEPMGDPEATGLSIP